MTTLITNQDSIAQFNRGPVTSIFTPPASCLSTFTLQYDAMYFGHWLTGYSDLACFPTSTLTEGLDAWGVYYYSPATCPSGWSKATTFTSIFSGYQTNLNLGSLTTAALCCPSGYSYADDGAGHECQSAFASTTSTLLYIDPTFDGVWYSTNANTPITTIADVANATYYIHGDGIPVWWQSSDSAVFAAATESSSSSSTPTQPSATRTNPTSTPMSSPAVTLSPYGLSSGAKIGIGIGIPLVVIVIGVVAFILYLRSRRRVQPPNRASINEAYSAKGPHDPYHSISRQELPS